jgi:diguanylate cyclase (GGDEF)-like protein
MKSSLKRQNERLTALYAIALDLLNHQAVEDVLNTIVLHASKLLDAPVGFLDILDGDMFTTQATTDLAKSSKGQRVPLKNAHLTKLAIQTHQPQFVENYSKRPNRVKIHDPFQIKAACTFPIMINDKPAGVLSLGRTEPNNPFTAEDMGTLRSLAQLAALAVERAHLFEETQKKAVTDGLTELANRRQFDALLAQEWKRALRAKRSLALIMVDVDVFKKYNDTYGHTLGDKCLKQVAQILAKAGRRQNDISARYGGEEFALVLPNINLANAKRRAEYLRKKVEALRIPHQSSEISSTVTVSLGVAALIPTLNSDPATLINLADQALYKAKQMGRNRVCSCAEADSKL